MWKKRTLYLEQLRKAALFVEPYKQEEDIIRKGQEAKSQYMRLQKLADDATVALDRCLKEGVALEDGRKAYTKALEDRTSYKGLIEKSVPIRNCAVKRLTPDRRWQTEKKSGTGRNTKEKSLAVTS